ncbi:unnamed protein product [Thelazia callipaeda]|uniref:Tyrosinase_Cu-bd domain-containing protein n=1 Tax=Thelazia callipaeda TaxID=103827 RepID=A0A0N5CNE4_THECL|nr:unnamed protein product [Thelazia callipaeda]
MMWLLLAATLSLTFVFHEVTGQRSTNQQTVAFRQTCNDAPTPSHRSICLSLQRMARNSSRNQQILTVHPPGIPEHLRPGVIMPGSRGQVASHPYDCMTIPCLCPYLRGAIDPNNQCILRNGQIMTMAYRKEYRMLTEDERLRYHNALTILKRSGEYDRIGLEHQSVGSGSGAHSGPGFLPWHREFIKRFEIALRLIDPSVSIPYWDSALDSYLPNPRDSILFSPYFVGETDMFGNVVNGPFAYWSTLDGRNAILRNLGQEGQLFTEASIGQVMQQSAIENILAYTAPFQGCPYPINYGALEYSHSNVHLWIGGHMKPTDQSTNDPIFYAHHAFVDFIWELWRQNMQPAWIREQAYAPDIAQCADPQHFSYALMRPFYTLTNRDGMFSLSFSLSNMYTDQMYRYAPRPGCTAQQATCGSPYLFCDTRGFPHCVSKIKFGGLCFGFEAFDACFDGICIMGRCVSGATTSAVCFPSHSCFSFPRDLHPVVELCQPFVPQMQLSQNQRRQIEKARPEMRQFVNCFNRHHCCEMWARNDECRLNANYMRQYCQAACHVCNPSYNASNECPDRHISCRQWSMEGQCRGDSNQFMAENCRQSCGFCNRSKEASCPRPSRVT